MLRVVLVDDEALARQRLRSLLLQESNVEIVGEAASVNQALEVIAANKPDALFLDIRMPGADGFALIDRLPDPPKVVFVTAYPNHAVEAFAVEAVDYLLKPVRPEHLARAVRRLGDPSKPEQAIWNDQDRFCFRMPERTVVARYDAILALKAEGDFTRIYLRGEPTLFICHAIGYYEERLPAPPFLRANRSLIMHTGHIKKMEAAGQEGATLWMEGLDTGFELGRTARRRVQAAMNVEGGFRH